MPSQVFFTQNLLKEFNITTELKTNLFFVTNPIFNETTKHIKVDCHFVRDKIKKGVTGINSSNFNLSYINY